ncbi:SRPBCC family protein [Pseudonocardia humida]|uniref:SRPBCC family protein n=1 Tax=Pseudonocardia humida TaxID=2800819 RepID=A0ABT1A1F7_9PSEU|nr:SRPBCC family protein [Pseudonocardia humida]MCO1656832.1 SRPBCC family protein [Pseudonocardia humida]
MQLENKFTIEAPIEKAWEALNTPEMIAPCFPGATLTEYEGDSFTGTVKVKLGPISLTYKGKGTYVTRDESAHKVVIEANGRDSRGNGTASATVTGSMTADGPDKTAVTMVTDMTITGRPAQFGRGVISDVADKIIGQFATCVAGKLTSQEETGPASPAGAGSASSAAPAPAGSANGTASSTAKPTSGTATGIVPSTPASSTGVNKPTPMASPSGPMKSDIDAIDLLDTAGAPVLKRLAPVLAGGLLLLIIFLIRRSRSGS